MSDPIDIVERLRARRVTRWVHATGQTPQAIGFAVDAECEEAADEIDRLRAAIAQFAAARGVTMQESR